MEADKITKISIKLLYITIEDSKERNKLTGKPPHSSLLLAQEKVKKETHNFSHNIY